MQVTNRRRGQRFLSVVLFTLGFGSLSGCSGLYSADDDPFEYYRARRDSITFQNGNAIANNIAVQTVDPWPRSAGDARIDVDGERLLIAGRRYQADKVEKPHGLATQSIVGSGANGSSTNGN
jgi:hypothetical protein